MTPEQAQETKKNILEKQETDFQATIVSIKKLALDGKLIIAKCGIEEILRVKKDNFPSYFEFLLNVSYSLILFPDPTMYDELKNIGVSPNVPKWFVSRKSIENQFEEISNKNIVVLKHHALITIFFYLSSKIRAEMLNDCHLLVGENEGNKDELMNSFKNIFRRIEYGGGSLRTFKNDFDIIMNAQIQELDKKLFNNPKKTKKFYLDSFNGKTEKIYIRELISCFIRPEGMLAPEFADAISGLMGLLLKDDDKKVMDESEFWDDEEPLYGNNYKRYLASRYNKIAGLSEPNFFES
ncbi:MAG TPA: hypothetical protein VI461_18370 [Chitinophagaceae bacterium]|nr:hypothetical protein [Chitinophagaceae bacterium]